jgi:hypothetical protein
VVIARFGECLTAAAFRATCKASAPIAVSIRRFLKSPTSATSRPLEASDFLTLADRIDPFSLQSKRAFVAQTSPQKHAAWMHKILRNQRNFGIFKTLEEAEDWITS